MNLDFVTAIVRRYGIAIAIVMLIIWAIVALVFSGPGWIHLLLTVGVSMLIWQIVVRTDKVHPKAK